MIIWFMRISCWIPKAKNAHTGCVILIVCHSSNGCAKVPQCYVIRILPAFFNHMLSS